MGILEEIEFATKPQIVLAQLQAAHSVGVARGAVQTDAAHGSNTAWRDGLAALDLSYAGGIGSSVNVWLPGQAPKQPGPWEGYVYPEVCHR